MMNGPAMYTAVAHQNRETLVCEYAPLVKQIAFHLISRLPPSVQVEDLIQAGMIGLLESMGQYDSNQGASFKTYAGIRIRGAMLDEMRRLDWTPRSVHRKSREVARVIHMLESQTGEEPSDADIVRAMGITMEEYHTILQDVTTSKVFSYDQMEENYPGMDEPSHDEEPLDMLQREGFQQSLAEAIKNLPEREQLIMSLYYDEELNLKEIGAVLGVSESRISQIHGRILIKLRNQMLDWVDEEHNV